MDIAKKTDFTLRLDEDEAEILALVGEYAITISGVISKGCEVKTSCRHKKFSAATMEEILRRFKYIIER